MFFAIFGIICRVCSRLSEDHALTSKPDIDTPFQDKVDVVKRLLPYHVYQLPMEDLVPLSQSPGKGKMKATEEDLLREEIAGAQCLRDSAELAPYRFNAFCTETRFALQCWKRRTALEQRFRRARTNSGKVRTITSGPPFQ